MLQKMAEGTPASRRRTLSLPRCFRPSSSLSSLACFSSSTLREEKPDDMSSSLIANDYNRNTSYKRKGLRLLSSFKRDSLRDLKKKQQHLGANQQQQQHQQQRHQQQRQHKLKSSRKTNNNNKKSKTKNDKKISYPVKSVVMETDPIFCASMSNLSFSWEEPGDDSHKERCLEAADDKAHELDINIHAKLYWSNNDDELPLTTTPRPEKSQVSLQQAPVKKNDLQLLEDSEKDAKPLMHQRSVQFAKVPKSEELLCTVHVYYSGEGNSVSSLGERCDLDNQSDQYSCATDWDSDNATLRSSDCSVDSLLSHSTNGSESVESDTNEDDNQDDYWDLVDSLSNQTVTQCQRVLARLCRARKTLGDKSELEQTLLHLGELYKVYLPKESDSLCFTSNANLNNCSSPTRSEDGTVTTSTSTSETISTISDSKNTKLEVDTLRGLEDLLCPDSIRSLKKFHVANVLRVQLEHQKVDRGANESLKYLAVSNESSNPVVSLFPELMRKASLKSSRPLRQMAVHLAKYDTKEAVRAVFSRWRDFERINP